MSLMEKIYLYPKKVPTIPDIDIKSIEPLTKGKIVTQAALAKKILRKNLSVNKKIVFDDKGEPVEEFPLEQKSEKVKLLDEKCKSGIDIAIAKEIMEDEDKIDKELQRKIIKEKHKAKRLKEREEKKKKAEEAKKRFAERKGLSKPDRKSLVNDDSQAESEEESEVESEEEDSDHDEKLSKYIDELPDPDEYYGNDEDDEDEDGIDQDGDTEDEESDQEEDESEDEKPRKRMRMDTDDESDDDMIPLSLQDAEALAKQFVDD